MWMSWRREICPYCFEPFWLKDAPFRCSSPPMMCAPKPDQVLADNWGDRRPVGKVLPPSKLFRSKVRCGGCRHDSYRRLCPLCHMELPRTLGKYRNLIFAVIGAKQAGKSHYISVLIHRMRHDMGRRLGLVLEALNDETQQRYRDEFYQPVYVDKTPIVGTSSALGGNLNVRKPLLYSLTATTTGPGGQRHIRSVVTLVFFDTAGEDLDASATMEVVNKYIYRSDGIILLIDPLQLDSVRAELGSAVALPEQESETTDILNRTTRLIENGRGLDESQKLPIPLAVAFSKFDAVDSIINPQYQLKAEPNHEGGFDARDFDAINAEMETLLDQWNNWPLLNLVKTRYRRYGFFGISALGCNPHGTHEIPQVVPRRVEDPFLWLLSVHGQISTIRN